MESSIDRLHVYFDESEQDRRLAHWRTDCRFADVEDRLETLDVIEQIIAIRRRLTASERNMATLLRIVRILFAPPHSE